MIRYKEGEVGFEYNNRPYTIHFHGSWLLDGPVGYEAWLQESLVWNLYDSNDREMSELPMYNNVWLTAEKVLTDHIWSITI